MREYRSVILLFLVPVLGGCVGSPAVTSIATQIPEAISLPSATTTAEAILLPTDTPEPTATSEPTPTTAPTSPPEPTESPSPPEAGWPTPSPDQNWLVNGNFANKSFTGWNQVNGYWTAPPAGLHDPLPCSTSGTWYLQMDRDTRENGWPPPPSEDWAWQDITPPVTPSTLYLHYEEAHHMHTGIIQLTVYGRAAGAEEDDWSVVFQQTGAQSPFGTGKCGKVGPPATFDYKIPVDVDYEAYRLEIYGKMVDPEDGVLWGDFWLYGE